MRTKPRRRCPDIRRARGTVGCRMFSEAERTREERLGTSEGAGKKNEAELRRTVGLQPYVSTSDWKREGHRARGRDKMRDIPVVFLTN